MGPFLLCVQKTDPLYDKLSVICVLHPVGKTLPLLMGFIDCGFSVVTIYTGNLLFMKVLKCCCWLHPQKPPKKIWWQHIEYAIMLLLMSYLDCDLYTTYFAAYYNKCEFSVCVFVLGSIKSSSSASWEIRENLIWTGQKRQDANQPRVNSIRRVKSSLSSTTF